MNKVCLDGKTALGIGTLVGGAILLWLAYFKSFLSLLVIIAAFAAIIYGLITLGFLQKALGFLKGFIHHKK